VACRRQVSRNRLNRFKQNDRHDEQRQSRIWAKRHNPRSQAFENPTVRQPAKDRFEESEKDGVHQEVDGGDQKHKGFEYAAQAGSPTNQSTNPPLSSRVKATNYKTTMEPLFGSPYRAERQRTPLPFLQIELAGRSK
jgi:hypothetical protein